MNIFYLSHDQKECAEFHNNSHCVKMILEYSQLLSTAHRILDGTQQQIKTESGRNKKIWQHPNPDFDHRLYSATHVNHPSAVWARQSISNYRWLVKLLNYLCEEYTHRYGKIHKVERTGLLNWLNIDPKNIQRTGFTQPTPAMPDEYKVPNDSIASYRNYYNGSKQHLAKWKNREQPFWFHKEINARL